MLKMHSLSTLVLILFAFVLSNGVSARPSDWQASPLKVNFTEIYEFARVANDSYNNPNTVRDRHPGVSWVATPGHTNVLYFIKEIPSKRTQIIAIRGTVDSKNWSLDMDAHGVIDKKTGILSHRGFNTVAGVLYRDLKKRLKRGYKIYLAGHSLGGAAAVILATYLDRDGYKIAGVYTFGQPKVTDRKGAKRYSYLPVLRIVYQNDIVPTFPDKTQGNSVKFAHIGPAMILLSGPYYSTLENGRSYKKAAGKFRNAWFSSSVPDHKMKAYLKSINQKRSGAKYVPFKSREKYIVRNRPGRGGHDTLPGIKRKQNFGSSGR